jgi:PAS domain S-box-containing protein
VTEALTTAGDTGTSVECRLAGSEGHRWFSLAMRSLGRPEEGWLCTAVDIDHLRQQSRALRDHVAMLDASVDCIKIISTDGDLIQMNRAGCVALGITEGSPFGMNWASLLPADVQPLAERALAAARAGTPARFPGRSVSAERGVIHWDNALAPLRQGDADQPTAILCVSRDVTAETEALAALQASEERLATALHVGGMGVWDYDIQRDHLCCDEQWYRMVGADPARPVHSIDDFRPYIHPADRDRATEVVETAARAIERGADYAVVFRIVRPNGDVRWVRSAAHLQHKDGTPMRAVGFIVDVTDAWRGELALRNANRNLEKERRSLARQALEDPLTGVANRRHLDRELARMCELRQGRGCAAHRRDDRRRPLQAVQRPLRTPRWRRGASADRPGGDVGRRSRRAGHQVRG